MVVAGNLMRHLNRADYSATLVSAAEPAFVAHQVGGGGKVIYLRPRFSYVEASKLRRKLLGPKPTLLRRIINRAVFTLVSLLNVSYAVRVLWVMRTSRTSVVHCNSFNREGLIGAWLFGLPCVVHVHGLMGKLSWFYRLLLSRLNLRFVAISEVVASSVKASGLTGAQVDVLYNPVDAQQIGNQPSSRFRKVLRIADDTVLVGIVGRVVQWKGQLEFVKACLRAFEQGCVFDAVVVGDSADFGDEYLSTIRQLISTTPFSHRFHFAGFVQDTDSVYSALDVLVHASIEPEPFGLVISEAMSYGVPVIAAPSGAPLEFVKHGETGLLCNPTNVDELSNSIISLVKDSNLRKRLGAAGRQYVTEHLDSNSYARAFERIYDELIERSSLKK